MPTLTYLRANSWETYEGGGGEIRTIRASRRSCAVLLDEDDMTRDSWRVYDPVGPSHSPDMVPRHVHNNTTTSLPFVKCARFYKSRKKLEKKKKGRSQLPFASGGSFCGVGSCGVGARQSRVAVVTMSVEPGSWQQLDNRFYRCGKIHPSGSERKRRQRHTNSLPQKSFIPSHSLHVASCLGTTPTQPSSVLLFQFCCYVSFPLSLPRLLVVKPPCPPV